jgi:hypothetical protein
LPQDFNVTSDFTTTIPYNIGPDASCSNWDFFATEFHGISRHASPTEFGFAHSMQLRGCGNMNWYGGNIASDAAHSVVFGGSYNGKTADGTAISQYNTGMNFDHPTFYADSGKQSDYIFGGDTIFGLTFASENVLFSKGVVNLSGTVTGTGRAEAWTFNSSPGALLPANTTSYMGPAGHSSTAGVARLVNKRYLITRMYGALLGGTVETGGALTLALRVVHAQGKTRVDQRSAPQRLTFSGASVYEVYQGGYVEVSAGSLVDVAAVLGATARAAAVTVEAIPLGDAQAH